MKKTKNNDSCFLSSFVLSSHLSLLFVYKKCGVSPSSTLNLCVRDSKRRDLMTMKGKREEDQRVSETSRVSSTLTLERKTSSLMTLAGYIYWHGKCEYFCLHFSSFRIRLKRTLRMKGGKILFGLLLSLLMNFESLKKEMRRRWSLPSLLPWLISVSKKDGDDDGDEKPIAFDCLFNQKDAERMRRRREKKNVMKVWLSSLNTSEEEMIHWDDHETASKRRNEDNTNEY